MDYTDDRELPEVTDELLEEALRTTRHTRSSSSRPGELSRHRGPTAGPE